MEKVSIDPREYVVFDVETNGLKSKKDDLLSISFYKHRLTRAHREKQLKMSCQALHNAPPNRT